MLIAGNIANYNPAEGNSVYVLYDAETGRLYTKNHVMFLAFSGIKTVGSVSESDGWATLILQADLNRIPVLTRFVMQGVRMKDKGTISDKTLQNRLHTAQAWIWRILLAIGCGFKSPSGGMFAFGANDKGLDKYHFLMPISSIAELSDNVITVVEEVDGLPEGNDWIRLPMCQSSPLLGANIFTAASELAGVSPDVVQKVLSAVGSVIIDTGVRALQSGASAVDFFVPPIGTVELRANPRDKNGPYITVAAEASSALECAANIAYSEGSWDAVELLRKVATVRSHRWDARNTAASSSRKYEKEKLSGKKARRRNRELQSISAGDNNGSTEEL